MTQKILRACSSNNTVRSYLFRKRKDYTDLLTHIIKINNDCLKLRLKNKQKNIFRIYVDLSNIKIKNADYEFIKMLIPFLEEAYPNNLEKMYFQNTPFIFKTAYAIIRNFIDKETREKIIFVKKNEENENSQEKENCNKNRVEISEDKISELF